MATNVEIQRNGNESNSSVLRRFTKKVQSSKILPRMRKIRYASRKLSEYNNKKKALRSIGRKAEIENLIKLGKMVENTKKRR